MTLDELPVSETCKKYWKENNIELDGSVLFRIIYDAIYTKRFFTVTEALELFSKFDDTQKNDIIIYNGNTRSVGELINMYKCAVGKEYTELLNLQDHFIYYYNDIEDGKVSDSPSTYSRNLIYLLDEIKDLDIDAIITKEYIVLDNITYGDAKNEKSLPGSGGCIKVINNEMVDWWCYDEKVYGFDEISNFASVYYSIPSPLKNYDIVSDISHTKYGIIRYNDNVASEGYGYTFEDNCYTVEWYYEEFNGFNHSHEPVYLLEILDTDNYSNYNIPSAVEAIHGILANNCSLQVIDFIK